MNFDEIVKVGAYAGSATSVLGLLGMVWKILRYESGVHSSVSNLHDDVKKLDQDLRDHMKEESDTIYHIKAEMCSRSGQRDRQWTTLMERVDELFALVASGGKRSRRE